jgi:hypothetical protein
MFKLRKKGLYGLYGLYEMGVVWGVCLIVLGITGCDASALSDKDEAMDSLTSIDLIESMVMRPLPVKEEGAVQEFVLEVTMKSTDTVAYPDVINLLAASDKMPASLIYDDGTGYDKTPNDLIFTGVVTEACAPFDLPAGAAAKEIFSIKITCSGDFIRPGEDCEGYGVCPEEVSRSFLWGLIEYDTSVAVCWCGIECSYDIEFKIG